MTITDLWNFLKDALPMLALVGAPLFAWVQWSLGREYTRKGECAAHRRQLEEALDATEERRQRLELMLQSLPTAKDMELFRASIHQLGTQVSVLQESFNGQKALFVRLEERVNRIDTFLRSNA